MLQSVCLRPLAVLLCAAAVLEPSLAHADETPSPESDLVATADASLAPTKPANVVEAERHAAAAFDAYSRGDYQQANELYEQALAAAPSADILYNIARVQDLGLHNRARAIEFYQRYLEQPSARPPRSDLVKQRILELQASARAESAARGATPPEGPNTVPAAAALTAPDRTAPTSHPWTTSERVGAGLAGAGVVGLGIGIGFGLGAYGERDTWRADCNGDVCKSQRGVDAAHTAAQRATVATVALAAGGGLLAVGAAFWFLGSKPDEGPGLALQVGGEVGRGDLECALSGRF